MEGPLKDGTRIVVEFLALVVFLHQILAAELPPMVTR